MKKIILITSILCFTISLLAQNSNWVTPEEHAQGKRNTYQPKQQQQQSQRQSQRVQQQHTYAKAYVLYHGNWHEGTINITITNSTHYKATSYNFNTLSSGRFNGSQNFTKLNSNNTYAQSYNFNYYINSNIGTLYVIL